MDAVARRTAAAGSRPRWWTELPLLALVYAAYSAGRLVARGDAHAAAGHGETILRWEELLRIDPERALNRLFTATPALGIPADFAYASLHYLVTPAVLIWLWHRRPAHYRTLRTWLMLATLIGLIGFTLLPTAPPRLLDTGSGFADTMARFSSYGWWGGDASAPRGLGGMTNQFAAMPSLHVGWALWCAVVLWKHGRSRATRALAVAYPLVIVLVVMGTANHYLLDALAGTAVMGLGLLLTRPALRLVERVRGAATGAMRPGVGSGTVTGATGPGVSSGASGVSGLVAAGAADAAGGSVAAGAAGTPANVSGGCETSAGERIPRQPIRRGRPTAAAAASAAAADDGAATAAQ
ncbi:membrane protein [Streptomyces griseoflavus]|uniref:phosphatase PAP2 family protein n=1 Tax=Streptomyces rimosus TaxID=1927 RepID=UPI0004CC7AA1|nr:phosphatase PAP2 family protein [Streptomyces rimosus]KOG56542.1 membrane protein [Streptomyces griseoflavus]